MTEPRNERIPDELEPEVEDGRDEADQSDGLEMDSSWESMLDKRFADMADEQVVGLAQHLAKGCQGCPINQEARSWIRSLDVTVRFGM